MMLGIENYWLFVVSGIILNITPGADTMYIITRSVAQGRNAGIFSVLGISSGGLIHTLLAALGLSSIIASSNTAFDCVKFAGAVYLIYLGISILLKSKKLAQSCDSQPTAANMRSIYLQGIFTNLLNPKVALFFLSFLPQFINADQTHGPVPFLILGGTFFTTGTIWCLILACGASYFTKALRKKSKISVIMQKLTGIVFIGLGLNLALKR